MNFVNCGALVGARRATLSKVKKNRNTLLLCGGGAALAVASGLALRRLREADLTREVALITGGSRGLGFLLAREFALRGCRLIICARDREELERARADLDRGGAEVLAVACDITEPEDVARLVDEARRRYGRIDILVNNAGTIQVGPVQSMTSADFDQALKLMFWGMLRTTLAVLPEMLERRRGRIVNITSIGGKISVPHLLPYSCAKFAAAGFSEGLRAELRNDGVRVTTVVPGLMRTGSFLNAFFKGRQEQEYRWFSLGAALPFISMDAERAARQIVRATRRGEAERILSLPARVVALVHGVLPGLTCDLLGFADRFLLPAGEGGRNESARGMDVRRRADSRILSALTTLGLIAASRFHQYPGPAAAA